MEGRGSSCHSPLDTPRSSLRDLDSSARNLLARPSIHGNQIRSKRTRIETRLRSIRPQKRARSVAVSSRHTESCLPRCSLARLGPDLLKWPNGFVLKARVDNYFRSKSLDRVASAAFALVEELQERTHHYSLRSRSLRYIGTTLGDATPHDPSSSSERSRGIEKRTSPSTTFT